MAVERALSNVVKAVRPLRNDIDNLFAFGQEIRVAIKSLYDKYRAGQSSLEQARHSLIQVALILEGELKIWAKMIYRRLSPRMKARNAWRVQFKCAMSVEVFSLILKAVKKARSSYGVSYNEENKTISYDKENRLVRDFCKLSQLSRKLQVVISAETPFTISFLKRTQQVEISMHYKFTNEFGYTFS
ncbi:uncharacterized protein [Acropora muricata]|uniref:uncharacterized protein LOC114951298 n=1 Tax=Acropora millepora TaxID=45264 RepID=UPI001CF56B20|nr:uncharacterized protein LOC114951298 [Acropora millepora]